MSNRACAHCGKIGEAYGQLNSSPLCHPNVGMDCYRLVTIYGEEIGARLPGGRLDYMPTPIPDNGKVRRFGLDLDQAAFDRLGEALDRVTEAERAAWRDNR